MSDASRPEFFVVHNAPTLSEGNIQQLLARAPSLWAHVKVYAEGGENGVHAHTHEDHMFFVLAGEATFFGPNGETSTARTYEGVMIPAGCQYAFRSSGARNLVMLRVGAPTQSALANAPVTAYGIPEAVSERVDPQGRRADGLAASNKSGATPGVVVPGKTLGAPRWR